MLDDMSTTGAGPQDGESGWAVFRRSPGAD